MKQRPAALRGLARAQIDSDLALQLLVDAVEIMLQQDVFRRDRAIGFQLEHPVAICVLTACERRGGAIDRIGQGSGLGRRLGVHAMNVRG